MKSKQAYATLPHVPEFIGWLATHLDSTTLFKHEYVDRRTGAKWSCDSLYGAYAAYAWNHPGNKRLAYNPGSCSVSNDKALDALRADLITAGTNDSKVLQSTRDIMAWGGVTARNAKWLEQNEVGLGRMIHDVAAALVKKDPDHPLLKSKALRFNSGMTKVYSLLCPDFVIYDSRVAAAMGMLVVRYCQFKGLSTVPAALNFPWAAAKEAETAVAPKRRNPNTGTLQFKRLRSGSHHARWNMRASWVLSQVARHPLCSNSPLRIGKTHAQTLRNIEKSLFSIGYDLSNFA